MMLGARERISQALAADFGAHPGPAADLLEVLAVVGRVGHVLEHLEGWMARDERPMDPGLYADERRRMRGAVDDVDPLGFVSAADLSSSTWMPIAQVCGPQ